MVAINDNIEFYNKIAIYIFKYFYIKNLLFEIDFLSKIKIKEDKINYFCIDFFYFSIILIPRIIINIF